MLSLFVAASFALMLTAIFAFRFRNERKPFVLIAYFLFFMTLEWVGEEFFLPPGALGIEVALVCLGVAALFTGATVLVSRYDAKSEETD